MAVAVVLGATFSHNTSSPGTGEAALSIAACLALAGRREFPSTTVVATAALALPVVAIDRELAAYALLVPATALFSFGLTGGRGRLVAGGLGCLAVVAVAEALNPNRPHPLFTVQHLALLIAPVLAVEALRTHRDYRSILGERLALVKLTREQETQRRVQDERLRIARELHDVVAHTLTTINVQASVAGHLLESHPEQVPHALAVIEEASRDGIRELRAILGVLRDHEGTAVSRAPTPGLDDLPDLLKLVGDAGLQVELDILGDRPARVPEAVSLAAYRILQESLTNVTRHTAGAGVNVRLSFAQDELTIAVENAITGVRHTDAASTNGMASDGVSGRVGIVGMTERAEALGGTLTAAGSEKSFLVSARLPYGTG